LDTSTSKKILITGFAPFDGREHNASWIAARSLVASPPPAIASGYALRAVQIPVCWGAPRSILAPIITHWQPDYILSMGEGKPDVFMLETLACNTRKERTDNEGRLPAGAPIYAGGPAYYRSSAPCERIADRLHLADIPIVLSTDAGAFLCEELLYTLEAFRAEYPSLQGVLFAHLPPFNTPLTYRNTPCQCDETVLLDFASQLLRAVVDASPQSPATDAARI
jgi:pyroglutamyl-peptidase